MTNAAAERSYSKGLQSITRGDFLSGLVYFESAIALAKKLGQLNPPPRFLSYYGLCLALVTSRARKGIEHCERAVEREFYNPDLLYNLARVYLKVGRKDRAHVMLLQGLQLHPAHPDILSALRSMGIRGRPMVPFLARSNPLNRLLGTVLRSSDRAPGPT